MFLTQVYFASCFFEYKEITAVDHGALAITLGIFILALLTLNNQRRFLQEGSHHLQGVWRIRVPCSPLPEITTKVPLCTEHSPVIQANPAAHLPLTFCTSCFTPLCSASSTSVPYLSQKSCMEGNIFLCLCTVI